MRLVPFSRPRGIFSSDPGGLSSLRSEMDRMIDRYLSAPMGMPDDVGTTLGAWVPSVDISESENEICLRAEVPGVDPNQIEITVAGNRLILSGEKSEQKEEQDEHYYHCERRFGAFERSIELPDTADMDKISADHANGVLSIHVPKHETAKPKRISIESKSDGGARNVPVGEPQQQQGKNKSKASS